MKRANCFKDITGLRFGKVLVLRQTAPVKGYKMARWICQCDCGQKSIHTGRDLRRGDIVSCGCHRRMKVVERNTTHGMSHKESYGIWLSMVKRCHQPENSKYYAYGGRGISVCDRWRYSFENFYEDMGDRPEDKTIDRIDTNGNYEPSNCRWATRKEQARNTRRNNLLEYNGETRPLVEWAEIIGIKASTLSNRLIKGWSVREALEIPTGKRRAKLPLPRPEEAE